MNYNTLEFQDDMDIKKADIDIKKILELDFISVAMEVDRKVAEQFKRIGYNPRTYAEAHQHESEHPKIVVKNGEYEYYYRGILVCIVKFIVGGYEMKIHPEGVLESLKLEY